MGGNVGIGTTTPAYNLDVIGTGRFTEALTLDTPLTDANISSASKWNTVATTTKSITIESPTASENITLFSVSQPMTISQVDCIHNPTSGQTITFNLRHNLDRSVTATSSDLFTSNQTCTATTTISSFTDSINDATMAANEIIWLITDNTSSTAVHFTVYFKND